MGTPLVDVGFQLLSVLGLGFAQGLYALDAADGESEHGSVVSIGLKPPLLSLIISQIVNVLLQGLLAYSFIYRQSLTAL
jgi:hypothetical protein